MKKRIVAILLAAIFILLVGCGDKMPEWKVEAEQENGIFVLLPEIEQKDEQWYCNADITTGQILSINLIYPEAFGNPTETICEVDGKKVSINKEIGEQDGGGVVFYTLSAEVSSFSCNKKVTITQEFRDKSVKISFRPSMVADAFSKEY